MLVVEAPGAGGPHAAEDADRGAESMVLLARAMAGLLQQTGG
jgi:hypothetical protein